jgi:penicillin V acylase-like amidase (Ntn superfamily)
MCTHFQLKATDNSLIVGRSMEFAQDLAPSFYIHHRGALFNPAKLGIKGVSDLDKMQPWETRYGYVGINSHKIPFVSDGINEAGLSIGCLWLPGSIYQKVTDWHNAVFLPFFCDWILAHCGSIKDVEELVPQKQFWLPDSLASQLPLHFPIVDKDGNSVVVEFQDGEQKIYKNTVGVCTNAPWFPWHLVNLGNYLNLSDMDPKSMQLGEQNVTAPGHGGGLSGIPGNATPPSRFVRIAYLKHFAIAPTNAKDAFNLATHLLNDVDIPRGTVRDGKDDDYTQWAVIKNLTERKIAIRTHESMLFREIDLNKIDFATVKSHSFPVPNLSDTIDVTPTK